MPDIDTTARYRTAIFNAIVAAICLTIAYFIFAWLYGFFQAASATPGIGTTRSTRLRVSFGILPVLIGLGGLFFAVLGLGAIANAVYVLLRKTTDE